MKKWLMILAVTALLGMQVKAEEWLTDLPKAFATAKAEKKLVFVDFTGSDWCPPCKDLQKTVLDSKEFLAYAKTNFVLVIVDFPEIKKLPEALKASNEALRDKYAIEGYPTLILFDADGKILNRETAYHGEKPAEYIAKLEKVKSKPSN